MRPPIGFMGPGHQTPACFPTADARILLVITSGQTQCIFRLRGEKFRECRYSKQAPSIGRGLFLRFWGICSSSYRNLTYP